MMHPNSLALALVARTRQARKTLSLSHVREVMTDLFGQHLHAARVLSLANGVAGVLSAAVLSLHAIGHAYAQPGWHHLQERHQAGGPARGQRWAQSGQADVSLDRARGLAARRKSVWPWIFPTSTMTTTRRCVSIRHG